MSLSPETWASLPSIGHHDVIVVGSGSAGSTAAIAAARYGASVLLVEKDDFAAGTSSRSTKLIHGGLRYLETYQFKMVAGFNRRKKPQGAEAPAAD